MDRCFEERGEVLVSAPESQPPYDQTSDQSLQSLKLQRVKRNAKQLVNGEV